MAVDTFDKNATAAKIADRLIRDITCVTDPNGRVDLTKASPFCRKWAEGVFVWLTTRMPGRHTHVSQLAELMRRA